MRLKIYDLRSLFKAFLAVDILRFQNWFHFNVLDFQFQLRCWYFQCFWQQFWLLFQKLGEFFPIFWSPCTAICQTMREKDRERLKNSAKTHKKPFLKNETERAWLELKSKSNANGRKSVTEWKNYDETETGEASDNLVKPYLSKKGWKSF